jgi:hypothetical protein
MFIDNIQKLIQNINKSKADISDMLYNFFSQFILLTLGDFDDIFKNMVSKAIYSDFDHMDHYKATAHIIKNEHLEWPDKFMDHDNPRIYLSDIRNQVVFEFWRRFQQMIEAQWMPETSTDGTEEQNKIYKKVAHTIGSRMLDPRDSERLNALLIWSHYIKLILYVKKNIHSIELNKDMNILNSYCGSWLYTYNNKGMQKLIWELYLYVSHYDNE